MTTTTNTDRTDGLLRRTVLKAGAIAAGSLAAIPSVTAAGDDEYEASDNDDTPTDESDPADAAEVDEPDGFEVNVLTEHAPFSDDVAATFELTYPDTGDTDEDPIVVDLDDASTVLLAEARWDEGARSGWHRHPGMSIVQMVEGEIEHTMEGDCVPRTYSAGDAWIDPGHVHAANSGGGAFAYVTFLGIPDGEPATEWVEPVDC